VRRLFSVPAAAYPWALLVFWQLVMPGASFLGHLCGVLVGWNADAPLPNLNPEGWWHNRSAVALA
jgi:Rhomboid family